MKRILDASFKYTPSVETDVRKTFERVRREQQAKAPQNASTLAGTAAAGNIVALQSRKPNG